MPYRYEFFSSLQDECISKKDYLHDIDVWIMFKIIRMGDYHILYFKRGILLLADVSKMDIVMSLEYDRLDPCHYFSSPGLSRDTTFNMTVSELKLISDNRMCLLVEIGMTEGMFCIARRCSKANN